MNFIKPVGLVAASFLALLGTASLVNNEQPRPRGETDIHIDYVDVNDPEPPTPRSFDDSVKYDYSSLTYDMPHGDFTISSGTFVSNETNSMVVVNNVPFPYGTIEATIRSKNTTDTGIVFGLDDGGQSSYWEAGTSYYFYFLGRDGSSYLGKVTNGGWSALTVISGSAVDAGKDYKLKVVLKSNKISCYLDDQLKFSYRDDAFLETTKFGWRTGESGVTFKNINVTSEYLYE